MYRLKEIRAGINAFTLVEKDLKENNIPLKESVILQTLRLINRTISEELIRQWIKKFKIYMECEKSERKVFELHVR